MTDRQLNRREAAAHITETYGFRLSPRTLEDAAIPYIVVNGQAIYQVADLDRYAQGKIASAGRRIGGDAARLAL